MSQLQGTTNQGTRPAVTPEGVATPLTFRAGKYNELGVLNYYPDQYPLALEGSYFVFSSPTPGTGVAATTSLTAYASGGTKPFLFIGNNNVPGGPNIELDYLKIIQTAAQLPTSATNMQIAVSLDLMALKAATGTAVAPVNPNPLSTITTNGIVLNTVTTNADSTSARLVFQDFIEPIVGTTPCAVAGDMYTVKFGALDHINSGPYYQLSAGTPLQVKLISSSAPPVVIPPGWAACVKIFGTANAAAQTYSFEGTYRER
jgi:hypothetical protein